MSGATFERQLVNALDAAGFAAMRCPTSGGGTTRDLPDVLGLRQHRDYPILAIELKSTKARTAYADRAEVDALENFALTAGALPLIGAKFKRPGKRTPFYLVRPDHARLTEDGNYGIPQIDADERATFQVWTETPTNEPEFERTRRD